MPVLWSDLYAERTRRLQSSTIRELLKFTQRPEVISFAGGMPAPELFPLERFREAASRILADPEAGAAALQYSVTEGYLPLREMIARHSVRYGLHARPENVMITTGSQQALELLAKLFINPGERVAVEAPTYLGALQAFDVLGADYVSLATDALGLKTDNGRLAQTLHSRPKLMYLLPNFQNPSGVSTSLERRLVVVALADKYRVPIIEDDPYGQLRYEGEHLPPLLRLDQEWQGLTPDQGLASGNVIYLSTFSKILAPGLRVGWVIGPTEVISRLVQLKQSADLHSSSLDQRLIYEVGRDGFLDEHIRKLRQVYRERRDVMLAALQAQMRPDTTWTHPEGGLFVWLRLPEGMDSRSVLAAALKEDVAFVPGDAFFARDLPPAESRRYMRLNFSCAAPDKIQAGVSRLARAVHTQRAGRRELVPA